MSRTEFLQGLERALEGNVPASAVRENLRYYEHYISEQQARGRSEEEIIEELGDPRMIARTIVDTTDGASEFGEEDNGPDSGYTRDGGGLFGGQTSVHYYDLNKWYWKLLLAAAVVLVIFLVITVITGIFTIVLPLLFPVLAVIMILSLIRSLFRK